MIDCVIVGGGPAGLNAALVLGRARRKVRLYDDNTPRNSITKASHGFLTRDGVHPDEFRSIAYKEVFSYPSVDYSRNRVMSIEEQEYGFKITDASGEYVQAKKIIVATGLKEILPNIKGLKDMYGTSLFNCVYCDGWELRDKPLVVISESNSIFHTTQMVYNWSQDIVVCTNGVKGILTEREKQILLENRIEIRETKISSLEGNNGNLYNINFEDGEILPRSGGFLAPSFEQRVNFLTNFNFSKNNLGGFSTDGYGRTSILNLYVAGDSSYILPSQLIQAAADGSRVAMSVNQDLTLEEF